MTTKQIAESVGKGVRTVQRWTDKASVKMSSIGDKMTHSTSVRPADFSLDETIWIIETGMGKNAASVYRQNAIVQRSQDPTANILAMMTTMTAFMERAIDTMDRMVAMNPAKSLPAPKKSARSELNQLVRKYAVDRLNSDYHGAWNKLYSEILYRMHRNVKICASNEGLMPIDYMEREEMLDKAVAIIVEMMGE